MAMNSGDILMEGAIFKMKKTLTGFKWKRKWVRTDGNRLLQWATEAKPGIRTKPKHAYLLVDCAVREITANKAHAFCVHENSKNDMMVFAAKNKEQLDRWLEALTKRHRTLAQSRPHVTLEKSELEGGVEEGSEEADSLVEKVGKMTKRDLATMYFEEYDISPQQTNNKTKIAVDEKLFPDLMNYVGIKLSNSDLFFSLQSVKNEKKSIYLKDFLTWLEQHPELAHSEDEGADDDDVDGASRAPSRYTAPPKKALSFECDELLRLNHSGSSWLNILEPVHLAGVLDCKHVNLVKVSSVVTEMQHNMPSSDVVKTWPFEQNPRSWNSCYQELLDRVTDSHTEASKIGPQEYTDLYELCAAQSHFVQRAIAGSTVIVDEYSLPTNLKTATLLSVTEVDEEEDAEKETEEEIFFLNNLVFRLLGNSSTDKDQTPSVARLQYIVSSDEIVQKIAGNDFRSHEAVRKALVTISNNACHKGDAPHNANVLLTTLIDYCGFRLQVFSPLEIDEASTLLLGSATTEQIFVNALSDNEKSIIPALGKEMNLTLSHKEMLTTNETLKLRNPAAAIKGPCEVLSKDVQIHCCWEDERLYLFNFNNFLPPDLPRPNSNDVNTRHLRPEYVEDYAAGSIDSQAMHADKSRPLIHENSRTRSMSGAVPLDGGKQSSLIGAQESSLQAWCRAASHLHTTLVPQVVQLLDSMSALPLDSHGLTEFLHSRGVNIRLLGNVYALSHAPHVKDLVLSEAISRCVKSLLNQSLRNLGRKGRAETIIAEGRRRSQKEDFVNHQSNILTSKTATVIYFFNVVLGSGEETDRFWKSSLPKMLLSKFGLELPKRDKRMLVFFPQLVQALEYHTNVHFSREKQFVLASASCPEPFTEEDLVHYDCNFKFELTTAGIFHRCEAIAEAFLASSMIPQATRAFKIRLSTQNIFMRGISKPNKKLKHRVHLTTYSLAFCYYLDRKFDMCCSLLASILEEVRKGSPFLGRALTLLMSADFKRGRVEQALQHYEAARRIYVQALGVRHPVIALLYSALADLYFSVAAFSHAKLLVYKALDFSQRSQGAQHLVNAGHLYKLGTILLEEGSFVDATAMLREAMDIYALYSSRGAVFDHEMAVCYHGIAIADAQLGNISDAISLCKKSLAISTADDKYITAHAVRTIILLAEEHERKNDLDETINLYSDAWTIVQAYSKDFDLPKILVLIAARIFSTFINNQAMHFRMLFHTVGAECEARGMLARTISSCSAFIAQELVQMSPVAYISGIFQSLANSSDNNILSTHSRYMVGTQKSVFGVPCPNLTRHDKDEDMDGIAGAEDEYDEDPDGEPPSDSEPEVDLPSVSEREGSERGGGEAEGDMEHVHTHVHVPAPPLDVQVMTILRMVLNLTSADDRDSTDKQ